MFGICFFKIGIYPDGQVLLFVFWDLSFPACAS